MNKILLDLLLFLSSTILFYGHIYLAKKEDILILGKNKHVFKEYGGAWWLIHPSSFLNSKIHYPFYYIFLIAYTVSGANFFLSLFNNVFLKMIDS
ncbi:hypothetical protein [Halobacteriovorax sp.]|uniref:hypothetical protein n=1 Tax=Halobacteriovorax sp. TaxID=2020862 RepID=UPI003AF2A066